MSEKTSTVLTWNETFGDRRYPVVVEHHLLRTEHRAHDHDFVEIVIVLGGNGIHVSAAGEVPLKRAAALVLRPGAWHAYRECQELSLINCCFDRRLLRNELRWLMEDSKFATLLRGDRLQHLYPKPFSDLEIAIQQFSAQSLASAVGGLLLILDALVAGVELRPIRDRRTLEVLQQLEERPSHPWTVEELSAIVGVDPATLARRLRTETGLPPMAYLTLIRCERAATLLRSTQLSMNEIGPRVGWPDQNYFARRFRQQYGMSPTAYRNQYRA